VGRKTPPLHAVEAFLTAVRTSSFRAAADELCLTPSAFSRRIKSLETFLGTELFDRTGPGPRLTEVGRQYSREIQPALDAICESTRALRGAARSTRLRFMCPPSLAINWLMSRLRSYAELHPCPEIDLVVTRDLNTLRLGRADIGIASGPRDFSGFIREPLFALKGAIVSAPKLAGGRERPRSCEELNAHRLLGLAPPADLPRDLWTGWQIRSAYQGAALAEPVRFDTWALMYEAAANGMGVTIAVPAMAENYLREGRLAPCFGGTVDLDVQYSLLFASRAIWLRNDVRDLVAWLSNEANDSVQRYMTLINADTCVADSPGAC
jgi:LysR family transcriptional regulator, glycine cleavage system transcriptional activator